MSQETTPSALAARDEAAQLTALVEHLAASGAALPSERAGQVGAFVSPDGHVILLQQAQEGLRASETRFRTLFEQSPDPIFVESRCGKVLDVNPAACQLHGRARDELVGKSFLDLVPPEMRDAAALEWPNLISQTHSSFSSLSLGADGRSIPVEVRTSTIDFAGQPAVLLHMRDVTETKLAEKAILHAERFARAALDALTANIAILNEDGVILRVNQSWNNFAKANSTTEVAGGEGANYLKVCDGAAGPDAEMARKVAAGIRSVAAESINEFTMEYPCHSPEEQRWFFLRVTRFPGDGPKRIVVSHTNITTRKKAELRNQELAQLLNYASDAIVVRDLENRILFWNKGAEYLYGWTEAEAVGRNGPELVSTDPAALNAANEILMREGKWAAELQQKTRAGKEIVVQGRWTLVRDEQGRPKSVLIINTDITEKKRLEAQFLRAQRIEGIGNLAAGIAHDLNNVLAPILMAVALLRMRLPQDAKDGGKLIDTLENNARRGANLVRQVLGFARGYDGERIVLQPSYVVREILQIIEDTFPKSINLKREMSREIWTVTGDPTQLHQILLNLCVNARDAMPEGGTLTLKMKNVTLDEVFAGMHPEAKPGPYVRVSVADTGTGIPRAIQDRIFEPFFTTKGMSQGTGLGLSTVQALVKSHGGFITLDSEEGKGSTFRVYLPARTSPDAEHPPSANVAELPRGNNELILLADDEQAIRLVTHKTLETFGYRVLQAENGAEAVSLYALHRDEIAVVITDMAMPVMDGHATILALRSIDKKVKIIGSSGKSSGISDGAAKAARAGVDYFIPKPYLAATLLKTLSKILGSESRASLESRS